MATAAQIAKTGKFGDLRRRLVFLLLALVVYRVGAHIPVRGIDPTTGHYYDDTKRYIEASKILSAEDKHQVYEGNVRRVFSRLDTRLKAKGL